MENLETLVIILGMVSVMPLAASLIEWLTDRACDALEWLTGRPIDPQPEPINPTVHALNDPNTRERHGWTIEYQDSYDAAAPDDYERCQVCDTLSPVDMRHRYCEVCGDCYDHDDPCPWH